MVKAKDFEKDYYARVGRAHAFGGIAAIKRRFPFFSTKDIEKLLANIDAYTQHKVPKPIKYYNPHYVRTKRKQISADLVDVHWISEENDGITFLLLVVDNFSRIMFIRPLKQKTALLTREALKSIFDNDMSMPTIRGMRILTDRGTEFRNRPVRELLEAYGIEMDHAYSNKASHIERSALTLQRLLYTFMKHNNSLRYIDHLQTLVLGYNTRFHRSIGMSPIEAEISSNRTRVIYNLSEYWHKVKRKRKVKPKYKIGQSVRIRKNRHIFRRGYEHQFAREPYLIHAVHTHLNEPMYSLRGYDDATDILTGKFYENELTSYTSPVFKVVGVFEKRGNRVLVQKEGYRKKTWMKASDLRRLSNIN